MNSILLFYSGAMLTGLYHELAMTSQVSVGASQEEVLLASSVTSVSLGTTVLRQDDVPRVTVTPLE